MPSYYNYHLAWLRAKSRSITEILYAGSLFTTIWEARGVLMFFPPILKRDKSLVLISGFLGLLEQVIQFSSLLWYLKKNKNKKAYEKHLSALSLEFLIKMWFFLSTETKFSSYHGGSSHDMNFHPGFLPMHSMASSCVRTTCATTESMHLPVSPESECPSEGTAKLGLNPARWAAAALFIHCHTHSQAVLAQLGAQRKIVSWAKLTSAQKIKGPTNYGFALLLWQACL